MDTLSILAKKRDGLALSAEEIGFFVQGAVEGSIADYQAAAWLMAGRINGFNAEETHALTMAMLRSGEKVDLSGIAGIKADKHSTGGVGDKTSLVLMPVVAACGLKGAKMSGRGLGHTGGTLDKLEAIPGFRCGLSIGEFQRQVNRIGLAIISQSDNLAPADKLFYALRDVTATVDSIPLIASSIMSKKLATGADVLVLDVKYGSGALIRELARCRELAQLMVEIAHRSGIKAAALLTSMEQPLGFAIGNALEIREVLEVLEGNGPDDLREEALAIAAEMLCLGGLCADGNEARARAEAALASGAAREKFGAMVRAQGGDDHFSRLPQARRVVEYRAGTDGVISGFRSDRVGRAAMLLGAGRRRKEDAVDPAAGIVLLVKSGARVRAGETVALLHCNDTSQLEEATAMLDSAVAIGAEAPARLPLIAEIIR